MTRAEHRGRERRKDRQTERPPAERLPPTQAAECSSRWFAARSPGSHSTRGAERMAPRAAR